jgi:hypothetical protein
MEDLIPLLIVEVPLVASLWFFHKRSGRPTRPLRAATSVMVATAILLLAGSTGYNLNALDATAAGTPWTGAVLWWEVGIGLTLLPVAAHYWRKGIQSLSLRVL